VDNLELLYLFYIFICMGRKQKKIHYIYKTTCSVNGKYYIGMHSTDEMEDGYLGSGKRLWYSINYHGKENHTKEILEYCENREELKKREEEIVNEQLISEELCMNLMVGGQGGYMNKEHYKLTSKIGGDIHKERMENDSEYRAKTLKTLRDGSKKMWCDSEMREKLLKNIDWVGRTHSDKTKKLISDLKKGKGVGEENSQFGTCWITKGGENKKIKKELLTVYQVKGWTRGRKLK
jgi:hypothetical protein